MGARVKSGSSKKQPEPDINITPLVDVVLVLLIIFMVIAPELEHGERVELPTVIQPDETGKGLDPITVTMTTRGSLFIEKEVLPDLAALEARLKAMHETEPERRVVLKGDASVQYARMRDTFAACQRAGYKGVALSVSQKGKGQGEET